MSLFNSRFYDFNVHPDSGSVAELATVAKRYGYSGIAVVNSTMKTGDKLPGDFSIYRSIEISVKPSKLREELKKYKGTEAILTVPGGNEELNRAAVETEGLDILLQPAEFNNVLAKAASDNSIALGFDLGSLIHLRGEVRMRELMNLRTNLKYARKYDISMILTSNAHSIFDLRSPREMEALSRLFGMKPEEAVKAMSSNPLGILRRKSPDYIQEGIEIL